MNKKQLVREETAMKMYTNHKRGGGSMGGEGQGGGEGGQGGGGKH
jgi:uncharacterized membrane protein